MSKSYYAEAMEVVLNHQSKHTQILLEIAKRHPKVVADGLRWFNSKGWEEDVRATKQSEGSFAAIRKLRSITNMSLKDAKKTVDKL